MVEIPLLKSKVSNPQRYEVEQVGVKPYVYRRDDGYVYIDFVRPVMRIDEDELKKGGEKHIHRCIEVMIIKTGRMLLELAENLDWNDPIEIHTVAKPDNAE